MNLTLGVFDIFAYTIPGALYVALMGYVADRLDWIDVVAVLGSGEILVLLGIALCCYLVGHISYPLGRAADRVLRIGPDVLVRARADFLAATPAANDRPFVRCSTALLLAAIEVRHREAALEVLRLRAVSLMLRNSTPALALGAIVAVAEIATGEHTAFAVVACLICLGAALGAFVQGQRLRYWSRAKTFQVAFWVQGLDDELRDPRPLAGHHPDE